MHVSTFEMQGRPCIGLGIGGALAHLHGAGEALGDPLAASLPADLLGLIEAGPDAWDLAERVDARLLAEGLPEAGRGRWWWPRKEVRVLLPYIPRKNPWVIGANYMEHLANGFRRLGRPIVAPPHVEFFSKAVRSLTGPDTDIVYDPDATRTVDYECELTVVLGKSGRDIPASEAMDYVFGYTVANDVSARELQIGHQQYYRGKSQDGFCPLGPGIATTRLVPNPYALRIRQRVNGETRQDWPVSDMLYKIDELISVLSQGMTIEPGDMIITGTVPGVGFESMPQVWLQHGDIIEADIDRIGVVRNRILMRGVASGRAPWE